jgi:hypothetical protein
MTLLLRKCAETIYRVSMPGWHVRKAVSKKLPVTDCDCEHANSTQGGTSGADSNSDGASRAGLAAREWFEHSRDLRAAPPNRVFLPLASPYSLPTNRDGQSKTAHVLTRRSRNQKQHGPHVGAQSRAGGSCDEDAPRLQRSHRKRLSGIVLKQLPDFLWQATSSCPPGWGFCTERL